MENSHSIVDWGWVSLSWDFSSGNKELSDLKEGLDAVIENIHLLEFVSLRLRCL